MLGKTSKSLHAARGARGRRLLSGLTASTAVLALAFAGLAALAAGPATAATATAATTSAAPTDEMVSLCHATGNPVDQYLLVTVSLDAFKTGHGTHVDDIYPPNSLRPNGQNWDAAGQAIFNNGCATAPPATAVTPQAPTVSQATCTDQGAATVPVVEVASTQGIFYTVVGNVAAGSTVTVVATPAPQGTYALAAANGWMPNADGTASYTVVLDAAPSCVTEAVPAAPAAVQAVCNGPGTSTAPMLTLASTPGIGYTVAGTAAPGSTVTVTATPAAGYTLAAAAGWTANNDGTASYTVTFDPAPDCAVVVPLVSASPTAPTATQAVCTPSGTATTPALAPATTTGIGYTVNGTAAAGHTVTVTATPADGYTLAAAAGWTANNDGTASYTVTFDAAPECAAATPIVAATPTAPTATQAVCTPSGTATAPTLTLATTPGIDYTVTGPAAAGSTVTVTATPQASHKLAAAAGWTANNDGTASYTVTFGTVDCSAVTTPVDPPSTPVVTDPPATPVVTDPPAKPVSDPAPPVLPKAATPVLPKAAAVVVPQAVSVLPQSAAQPTALASTGYDPAWSVSLAIIFLVVGAGAVWRSRRPAGE
ncbi:hypothetical protein [Arthrobacter sp. STN4]|uniref:InlB B-repeat-containing protein n=1 Tax=Arthrobacter sp. STN4 TaxID=2923276 RepID=UPI002119FF3C|nr:hypothetical protein [Arthrobacter sp. STN4]MCQ9163358.1 hypothetical protein [Arthrobacter sp. STN4]